MPIDDFTDLEKLDTKFAFGVSPICIDELISMLKATHAYPESGYGSVTVNLQGHKITHIEKKESIKI